MSDSPEDEKMVPRFDDASEGGDELMEAMGIDPKANDASSDPPIADMSSIPEEAALDVDLQASTSFADTTDGADSGISDGPEPEREFYKCKKGHVTEDMWAHVARENAQGGEIIEDSGPICRVCFVRWVKKMFPAKRTKQTPNLKAVA